MIIPQRTPVSVECTLIARSVVRHDISKLTDVCSFYNVQPPELKEHAIWVFALAFLNLEVMPSLFNQNFQ